MLFREEIELEPGRRIVYVPAFFADDRFAQLESGLSWEAEYLTIFGKRHLVPRLTAYYGEYDYGYSNVVRQAAPMPDFLAELCERVSAEAGLTFNAVLGNLYRDGQDSMGWHADDEPEIDQRCIASVSFGATRRFRVKQKQGDQSYGFDLAAGSLLLMENCQQGWQHCLPKTKRAVGPRINLTFRRVEPRLRK